MGRLSTILAAAALCTAAGALPVLPAGGVDLNYEGYSWETDANGGYPPAGGPGVAGNVLYSIGQVIEILDETGTYTLYEPSDDGAEMTYLLSGLVSQGAVPLGPTTWRTDYVGGTFDIYFDDTPDYQPATGPGTYGGVTDGTLWLSASVVSFFTIFDGASQTGSFYGAFQITGGAGAPYFAPGIWTWGGSTSLAVPPGWTYMQRVKGDAWGEVVPEPSTLLMLGSALLGVLGVVRKFAA